MKPTNFYWHRAAAKQPTVIKCASCGKFVAYKNGIHGTCVYTPDSYYSSETLEWFCSKCNDRNS